MHSFADLGESNGEESKKQPHEADFEDGIPAAAREMPVDGEHLPTDFAGIYHEKQIGALCAVHALNNLVQGRCFDEVELASVAQELDAAEAAFLEGSRLAGEESSGNVRADGFFSVQVIVTALLRLGLSCAPAQTLADPARELGFIFNRREHWFALRRLGDQWFDLNSMFAMPKLMSPTHLALFFQAHADQGYSIFVVRGNFPPTPLDNDKDALARAVAACAENDDERRNDGPVAATSKFTAFSGEGQRLDAIQVDPALAEAARGDPELAAAIAASIADTQPTHSSRDAKHDAAEIRRKRLARFA